MHELYNIDVSTYRELLVRNQSSEYEWKPGISLVKHRPVLWPKHSDERIAAVCLTFASTDTIMYNKFALAADPCCVLCCLFVHHSWQHLVNMKQHYHLLSNPNVGRGWWERSNIRSSFIYDETTCFIISYMLCVHIHIWMANGIATTTTINFSQTQKEKMRAQNDFSVGRWK